MSEPRWRAETRASYDVVAAEYAASVDPEVTDNPLDRGVLDAFAAYVLGKRGGAVVDLGCGPGRVAAYLASRGLSVSGLDLSPQMVAQARALHPTLSFAVGDLGTLPFRDGHFAGALLWYSLIHIPPPVQPRVLAEVARVVADRGWLAIAFQSGDDARVRHEHAYGHDVAMDGYRISAARLDADLAGAGFEVTATIARAPEGRERTPQAYLLARRR